MSVTKVLTSTSKKISSCGVLLCVFFVVWSNTSYVGVERKGFLCNDTSIGHTYHGDSITVGILFPTLLGGAWIVVYVTELLGKDPSKFSMAIKNFYAGFVYVMAFTEVLKLFFGELRPHFLYSCQPDFDQDHCAMGLVTKYRCKGSGPRWLVDMDIYKSFPSGHASLSFYTFVFLSVYVLRRTPRILWRALVVCLFFAWACTCSISRAVDHRHFWWDIMAGVFIGIAGGFIQINFLMARESFKNLTVKSS